MNKVHIFIMVIVFIITILSLVAVIDSSAATQINITDFLKLDSPTEATGFINHASTTLDLLQIIKSAGVLPVYIINATGTILTPALLVQSASVQYLSATGGIQTDGAIIATSVEGANVTSGANPGHTHTGSSLSGIDISDDTNLQGGTNLTLSGDTMNVDDPFTVASLNVQSASFITDSIYKRGIYVQAGDSGTTNSEPFIVRDFYGNYILYATSALRLGIGTETPQNKLDVEGAMAVGESYSGTNTAPANGMIVQGHILSGTTEDSCELTIAGVGTMIELKTTAEDNCLIYFDDLSSNEWHMGRLESNNSFIIGESGVADRITIIPGGDVGIGTAEPLSVLHLDRTGSGQHIRFSEGGTLRGVLGVSNGDNNILSTDVDNDVVLRSETNILFGAGSSEKMRITTVGNVGIGATPVNKLDVEGAMAVGASYSGTYTAPANGMIVEGIIVGGTNTNTGNNGDNSAKLIIADPNTTGYCRQYFWAGDEYAALTYVGGDYSAVNERGFNLIQHASSAGFFIYRPGSWVSTLDFIVDKNGNIGSGTREVSTKVEVNGVLKCESVVQYCNDSEKRAISTIDSATQEELRNIVRNLIPKRYIKDVPVEFKEEKTIDDFKNQVRIVEDKEIISVSSTVKVPVMETVYEIVNKTDYNPDGTISFGTDTVAKEIQKMATEVYQERKTYIIKDKSGIIQSATWEWIEKERKIPVYADKIQWSTKEIVSGTHEEIVKSASDQLAEWTAKREAKLNHKNYNQERYGIVLNQSNVPDFLRVWSDDGNVGYLGIGELAMFNLNCIHFQQLEIDSLNLQLKDKQTQIDALEERIKKLESAIGR